MSDIYSKAQDLVTDGGVANRGVRIIITSVLDCTSDYKTAGNLKQRVLRFFSIEHPDNTCVSRFKYT